MYLHNKYSQETPLLETINSYLKEPVSSITELDNLKVNFIIQSFRKSYDILDTKFLKNFDFSKMNFNHAIIEKTDEYNLGYQFRTNKVMKYISFRNLMMIDWDTQDLSEIKSLLENVNLTVSIYKTTNGYHGYCLNKRLLYWKFSTLKYMKILKCDWWYIVYSHKYGFTVRLNKKFKDEPFVEKYIETVGTEPILPEFQELLQFKDSLVKI